MQWKRIVLVEQSGPITDNFSHAFELDFLRSSRKNGGCFSSLNCHYCSVASLLFVLLHFIAMVQMVLVVRSVCREQSQQKCRRSVIEATRSEAQLVKKEAPSLPSLTQLLKIGPLKDGKMPFGQSSSGAHKTHQAWLIQSTWNLEVFKDILSTFVTFVILFFFRFTDPLPLLLFGLLLSLWCQVAAAVSERIFALQAADLCCILQTLQCIIFCPLSILETW